MSAESATAGAGFSSVQRYTVKPYRPDGGSGPSGTAMLLLALMAAGAVLGYAAHWISQYFYLIIMFPAGIGFGVGFVGIKMVTKGRVRNPWLGGAAGFLGGVLAMCMMHYFDYRQFMGSMERLPAEVRELAKLPVAEQAKALDETLTPAERAEAMEVLKAAGVGNMLDYMNYEARLGVQIKKATSSSDRGINLGYIGTWIYWIVEVLIVAIITFWLIRMQAAEPFCVRCDRWKKSEVVGWLVGDASAAASAVQAGDLGSLRSLTPNLTSGDVRVTRVCCERCSGMSGVDVKLEKVVQTKNGDKSKKIAYVTFPPEALPAINGMFTAPLPGVPVKETQT